MNFTDWESETAIEMWCTGQHSAAADFLSRQPMKFGDLGDWPAWHVAPYAAIWAVESVASPGKVGWWVITGDLPADYASSAGISNPREAVAEFSRRWSELALAMHRGEREATLSVGTIGSAAELGPLLMARAKILEGWANDERVWDT